MQCSFEGCLDNTDLENANLVKRRPRKVNTDPEKGQNVVCVLIEKLRSFINLMGREKENLRA